MVKNLADKPGLLLVANWDSGVGYAWWLMESYWVVLAEYYESRMSSVLVYPSISSIPKSIAEAPIKTLEEDFTGSGWRLLGKTSFLVRNRIRTIYFSDRSSRSWVYLVFRLAGVRRIIVHDHTPGVRTPPVGVKRLFKRFLNHLPWINADICIGATEFIKKRYMEVGCVPPERCHVANNGIPIDLPASESAHARFGIRADRTLIVTVARATRYKGGVQALEALAHLESKQDLPEWHYLYLGDGPDLSDLQNYAEELGIGHRVSFPGRVSNVMALLPTADFALHPSHGEVGYSLSILEYMLCSLPVIVPNNPSVCGATDNGKTGIIYIENDKEALADAIQKLLMEPVARRAMGRTSASLVRERYNLERTHRDLLRIVSEEK